VATIEKTVYQWLSERGRDYSQKKREQYPSCEILKAHRFAPINTSGITIMVHNRGQGLKKRKTLLRKKKDLQY